MLDRIFGFARITAFAVVLGGVLGFLHFAYLTHSFTGDRIGEAQGMVALTGGEGRVSTALSLLEQNKAQRLLISGVNPETSREAIRQATNARADIIDCCVDLGLEASNTIGNAQETANWVKSHDYASVIVVTSDYHMPRALLELRRTMPQTQLIAYGVASPPPWENTRTARRWLQEYFKYVAVYGRETARSLTRSDA